MYEGESPTVHLIHRWYYINQTEIVENRTFFRPIFVVKSDFFLTKMRAFEQKIGLHLKSKNKTKIYQVHKQTILMGLAKH